MTSHDRSTLELPEELSDEAVAALVECLYELAGYLENRYFAQLHRYDRRADPRQQQLWNEEEEEENEKF